MKENESHSQEKDSASTANEYKKKSRGSRFFLKTFFFLILAGAAGLGGFWCFTKIKQGMAAMEMITHVESKISSLESNQKKIIYKLNSMDSKMVLLKKLEQDNAEISSNLRTLAEDIGLMSQAVYEISSTLSSSSDSSETNLSYGNTETRESKEANVKTKEAESFAPDSSVTFSKNIPGTDIKKEQAAPPEKITVPEKGRGFDDFMRSFLSAIGTGLKWLLAKCESLFNAVIK